MLWMFHVEITEHSSMQWSWTSSTFASHEFGVDLDDGIKVSNYCSDYLAIDLINVP